MEKEGSFCIIMQEKKKQQRVMLVVFAAVVNPDINKQDSLKMATL